MYTLFMKCLEFLEFLGLQRCTPIRHTRLFLGYGTETQRGLTPIEAYRGIVFIGKKWFACKKQHDISDLSNTRNSIFTFYAFWNLSGPRYIEECQCVRLSLQAKNLFSAMCVSSRLPNLTIYTIPICCILVEGNRGQTCKHTGFHATYSGRIWTKIKLPIWYTI